MICYQDRCWCSAGDCEQYEWCKNAIPFAVREQTKAEPIISEHLPYAARDKSEVCRWYKKKREIVF